MRGTGRANRKIGAPSICRWCGMSCGRLPEEDDLREATSRSYHAHCRLEALYAFRLRRTRLLSDDELHAYDRRDRERCPRVDRAIRRVLAERALETLTAESCT